MLLLLSVQESQRKVALLEAMVTALRDRLHEEEGRNEELQGESLTLARGIRIVGCSQGKDKS